MKKTSKGVDGRIVEDLETPQLNCFGQNGSLWWRRNPLPSKGVGRNWMKHQNPGRWGTEQALHLNSWLVWHPVTLLEATANILEQLAWDPTQWGVPKKACKVWNPEMQPSGHRVEWTTRLLTSPIATTNHNTKRNRHQMPSSETVGVLADQSREWPWQCGPEIMNRQRHDFKAKAALWNPSCVPDSHVHCFQRSVGCKLNSRDWRKQRC